MRGVSDIVRSSREIQSMIITSLSKNYNGYKFSTIINYQYWYDGKIKFSDVYDTNNILPTIGSGIHVFMNDKYKNVLIIINCPIAHNEPFT